VTESHALGGHLWHLVIGLVPVAAAGMAIAIDRIRASPDDTHTRGPVTRALLTPEAFGVQRPVGPRMPAPRQRATAQRRPLALLLGAAGCLVAAAIHLDVAPEHFGESGLYGAFFLAIAAAQVGAAGLMLSRPTPASLRLVALGNVAVVLLWAWTRVVGIPLGPAAGETEMVGLLDVLAGAAELVAVLGCLMCVPAASRVGRHDSPIRVIPPSGFKNAAPFSRST
jgi:hypothetical protein